MPRNITVTLADGKQHVYANAPDDITPEAVSARATKEFGQAVTALDGGRGAAPAKLTTPAVAPRQRQLQKFSSASTGQAQNALRVAERSFQQSLVKRGLQGPQAEAALAQFRADPRYKALAAKGQATPAAPARSRDDRLRTAGRELAAKDNTGDFSTAFGASVRRNLFGIPERLAAAGERWLPSVITGNTTDASYDDILKVIRSRTDAEMGRSTGGNILGAIAGGGAAVRGAAGLVTKGAAGLAATGAPAATRVANVLQNLSTLKKGQTAANAGKLMLSGAAGGATQSAGEGSNVAVGAGIGAAGAGVLGVGFKGAQVLTRPFRDFSRLSSAGQILNRLTKATKEQLSARAAAYRNATGAEPTLFELLPLADRNKILKQAVVGRDNVVETASDAIRNRAANLGPEMADRTREILRPRRNAIEGEVRDQLTQARGGTPDPADAGLAARAVTSPTDMLHLRDVEARAIMAPHENTPVVGSLDDLYPSVPSPDGSARIAIDPEVSNVIRSAAGVMRARPGGAGVTAGDVADMISTLRADLGKGGIEGRTAQRAIDHLQGTLDDAAPDAGAAARQMNEAYAARSRMIEGQAEGAATRLRDDIQVGTSRKDARRVRNAYDTTEGTAGRTLGQGNRVLTDLAGSPEEALRATVQMSRNSTGRQLAQNVGVGEANAIMTAARAQDESARALAAASSTAQAGGGEAAGAETLVSALAGLHPSSFITTKAGAVRKLLDMTYIPENRARTMVDMIFSQDPAMVRRALNAVGNENNGAKFMKYLSGLTGQLSGGAAASVTEPGGPMNDAAPSVEDDLAGDASAPSVMDDLGETEEEFSPDDGAPIDETESPYAANLQEIYDTESPEMVDLISRVSGQESGGQQFGADGQPLTSSAGAIGVMQVMPDTAPEAARLAGVPYDENAYRNDPAYNKLIGIAYLSEMLRRFDGDVAKATAAYNAGPGAVVAALKAAPGDWLSRLPAETQDYVQKVA